MKHSFTTSVRFGNYLAAVLLAGVPFHAFVTVWASSLVGGYTLLRLWSAALLAVCAGLVVYWAERDLALLAWLRTSLVVRLIGLYALLHLVIGLVAYTRADVTLAALAAGWLQNGRFLVFFIFIMALGRYSVWLKQRWPALVLVPAMAVALIAILQYNTLPPDILRHFGYGPGTIAPVQTINNNPEFIRVQSTLRGPNALGAYLVVVCGLLAAQWRRSASRVRVGFFAASAMFALVFSFSRSAWIGAVLAAVVVAVAGLGSHAARVRGAVIAAGAVVLTGVAFVSFSHSTTVQNIVFHTEDRSSVAVSSNDQRESALRGGLRDVVREPLGRGPGTAGPASVHNTGHEARLAENYYLQIGQEVGWVGVALFALICLAVAYRLWLQRDDPLSLGLLAAFVGLAAVAMLSHAWTDDTLAFVWWGLAGIALAPVLASPSVAEPHSATLKRPLPK